MADVVPKPQKTTPDNANPNKFLTHFLYKAAIVTLLLVLLPLFPSLAPQFINQTLHARSWEFLQLIFVGIAVSYGLFSTRNDVVVEETHKLDSTKALDNAQSYVSKLLQVPSVFDDEPEQHNDDVADENSKVQQTWSSQYYREEPAIKVAKETSLINSDVNQKPLLLPVRSLKQRVIEDDTDKNGGKIIGKSNSKRIGEIEVGGVNLEKENVVLRSPIPWRSRSGRIEIDENDNNFVFPPSIDDDRMELNSRSFRSSRPNSSSFESQSKSSEDVVKKKKKNSPSIPPPPPPPPPPSRFLRKSSSSVTRSSNERALRRSVRSVPMEEFSESEMEDPPRMKTGDGSQSGRPVRMFKKSFDGYGVNVVDEKVNSNKKVVMDSSDDESGGESESEEDISTNVVDDHSDNKTDSNENENESGVNNGGPDVDKKADEFIAKFREQIRLQRIESIRRSTAQRAGKTTLR